MKLSTLLFTGLILFFIAGCDDDKEGSLVLQFRATYDGEPLTMLTDKTFSGLPIRFGHLSMYVSDIQLLKEGGSELLSEVELVDLSYSDPVSANEGFSLQFNGIPEGNYNGLRFSIGVPADLNAMVPADFSSSHPLSRTGYYWQAWESYIFMKIEGNLDSALPGSFETPFAYHTGSNELFRTFEIIGPAIQIDADEVEEGALLFDYKDVLEGLDILANPQNHNPQDTVQINRIVNNLSSSINFFL